MIRRLMLAVAVVVATGRHVKAAPVAAASVGWSEWGDWSPCSTTCGGGISSQYRNCTTAECEGENVQYRSCCIEACSEQTPTFREQQCVDQYGNWVQAAEGHNECTLACVDKLDSTYFLITYNIAPGTKCRTSSGSNGVCLHQTCASVGCDGILGSTTEEDKCLQCVDKRKNHTSCRNITNHFNGSTPVQGTVAVVTLPQGATTVHISHPLWPNEGTLALVGQSEHESEFTRMLEEGQHHRIEHWIARGPLTNEVTVEIVDVDGAEAEVDYTYYQLQESPSEETTHPPQHVGMSGHREGAMFRWVYEEFAECSVSCGVGLQTAQPYCEDVIYPKQVPDIFCEEIPQPLPINRECDCGQCPARWEEGEWSVCSAACASGVQTRVVQCRQGDGNVPAQESECQLAKPEEERWCTAICQPAWQEGEWSQCSVQCGQGEQERTNRCVDQLTNRTIGPQQCSQLPPLPTSRPCLLEECDETCYWQLKEWRQCDKGCGIGNRTRRTVCRVVGSNHKANETCCVDLPEPLMMEECYDNRKCLTSPDWQPRSWRECEGECCQQNTRHRDVECVAVNNNGMDIIFPESYCNSTTKPARSGPCMRQDCPQWTTSQWGPCSTSCGEGMHSRRVECLLDGQTTTGCCGFRPPYNMVCTNNPCPTIECTADAIPQCPDLVAQGLCMSDTNYYREVLCCRSCQK